jgi:hypothetical protein
MHTRPYALQMMSYSNATDANSILTKSSWAQSNPFVYESKVLQRIMVLEKRHFVTFKESDLVTT